MYENEPCIIPERNDPVDEGIVERALKTQQRIAIRPSRLKELQALEAALPALLEKAVAAAKREKLKDLHAQDTPEAARARAKAYADRNRDKINARRREQRKAKAAAKKGTLSSTAASAAAAASESGITIIKIKR
jgi:hypothetical protein